MNDAPAMGVLQRLCDLEGKENRFLPPQRAFPLHVILQGDAVDQLHDDVLHIPCAGHIVHRHNVGMGQHSYRLGFIPEAPAELFVLGQLLLEDLHRHKPVESVALCLVYNGHAAAPDNLQNLIAVIEHFADIFIHRTLLLE